MTGGALALFEDATLGYGRLPVLSEVSLEIPRGSFVGIVGPNGSGKTTLVKTLLGAIHPRSGRVVRPGPEVRVGYVPQRLAVDPLLPVTLLDLVLDALVHARGVFARRRPEDRERALRTLERLGLAGLAERPFRDLSGGQQQRGLLARALAPSPHLLVLDEPTNGMDIVAEQGILGLVRDLHEREGTTVLFVTHLLGLVADAADVLVLVRHGGVHAGPRDRMLEEETLSHVFGAPVRVRPVDGRTFIFAEHGPREVDP